jgi:hypothetical protein
VPAVERAAQVALLEGAAQVALLGRVAHTALLERAARPEQATRTALLVFSPPAAQAKTLSTPRVRALAPARVRPPRTNNSILRTDRDTVPPAAHWSAGSAECRRKATHSARSWHRRKPHGQQSDTRARRPSSLTRCHDRAVRDDISSTIKA